jgi:hypothetical protein
VVKYAKRLLFNWLFVRFFGLVPIQTQIRPEQRRILWINFSAPSLGDSIMDLSCRALIADRAVVLLTHPKNAPLFQGDSSFVTVYTSVRSLRKEYGLGSFDLVICDSYSPRVLLRKLILSPLSPFVGMYGYVNGFEVHRTLFSFARMRELLSDPQISLAVSPSIILPKTNHSFDYDICIAVGGEWDFRTYKNWIPVIDALVRLGYSICLVGSENGLIYTNGITQTFPSVHNTVGKLSLNDVVIQISRCKMFIGADGGLWNIASAIPVPSVVLFADCQIFDDEGRRTTRETSAMVCEVLYHDKQVSEIKSDDVISAALRLCERISLPSSSESG